MKIFLSNSFIAVFLKCVFLSIVSFLIIILLIKPDYWSMLLIMIIIFIVSLIFLFNPVFGYLKINKNKIYVSNDLTFKKLRMQHKEIINIDDIGAIEFLEEECTSNGAKLTIRYTGMPPYLKLIMKDGTIKRIFLEKYSKKTFIKLEKLIINNHQDILILKDAQSFIKWRKTGVL